VVDVSPLVLRALFEGGNEALANLADVSRETVGVIAGETGVLVSVKLQCGNMSVERRHGTKVKYLLWQP
jgi:hypothetical protein